MLLKYTKGGSYDSIYKCTYFLRIICQQKAHHTWKVWYFLHVRKFLSRRFHQPHSKHGFILLPIGFIRTSKLYMANFYFSSNKVSCIAFLIIKEIRIYFWKTKDKIKRILKKKKRKASVFPLIETPAASTWAWTPRWPTGVFCHRKCCGDSTLALCSALSRAPTWGPGTILYHLLDFCKV